MELICCALTTAYLVQAEVKQQKSVLQKLRDKATQERCAAVRQLLTMQQPTQQQQAARSGEPSAAGKPEQQQAASQQDSSQQDSSLQQQQVTLPALLLLNLSRHPNDDTQPAQLLPALAVQMSDACPLPPTSVRDSPETPIIYCLGADNRPMAVSAQHVVGVVRDQSVLQDVLQGQEDTLQRLQGVLDDAADNPKVWANLATKMFSCQVTFGSTLTSALAVRLNLPPESFQPVDPQLDTLEQIEHQLIVLKAAKQQLKDAQQLEKQQVGQVEPDEVFAALTAAGSSSDSSSSSSSNGSGDVDGSSGSVGQELAAAAYKALKAGADPLNVAKKMMRRAKKVLAETDEGSQTTWNSFMVGARIHTTWSVLINASSYNLLEPCDVHSSA